MKAVMSIVMAVVVVLVASSAEALVLDETFDYADQAAWEAGPWWSDHPDGMTWCYNGDEGDVTGDPSAAGPAPGYTDAHRMEIRDLVNQTSYSPILVHGANLYPYLQEGLYAEFRYYHQYDQGQPFYMRYGLGYGGTGVGGVTEGFMQRDETQLKMIRDGMERDDSVAATDLVNHWVKTRVVVDSYNDLGGERWHFKFYKQVEGVDSDWVELTTADGPYGLEISSELYVRFESYRPLQMIVDYVKVDVIPEPATLSLFGVAGLALLRRRRG